MKWITNVLVTSALGLSLLACSVVGPIEPVQPIPVPASLSEAGQVAQKAINEANVLLASASKLSLENFKNGFTTRDETIEIRDKLKEWADVIDAAQDKLDAADYVGALFSTGIATDLLAELLMQLKKRAVSAESMG
jgi:hypothetical protein